MIVSLDELKRVLGMDLTETNEDANLTRLIESKTAWVEGETHRRFDTPITHTQYEDGPKDVIYLEWHVDDSTAADSGNVDADPSTSVHVFRRPKMEKFRAWEELIEGSDWERQDQQLLFLRAWTLWPCEDQYKITYLGGYAKAPEDIKEVILELAMNQYFADADTSSGLSGLTSEKIGDYSYSYSGAAGSVVAAAGSVSDNSMKTLNRYKRKFV